MAGKRPRGATIVRSGFAALVTEIKGRIQAAQTRAMLAVNAELVRLYWDIGRIIDERQQREGWGAAVIPRLASELKNELPELKGFSERNIKLMLAFYREYPNSGEFVQQAVAPLPGATKSPQLVAKIRPSAKVPPAVALLQESVFWTVPWVHHVNRNMAYMSMQVLPSGPLLKKFNLSVSAIALRINSNNEESCTFAALRDMMLPELISGELRIESRNLARHGTSGL